MNESTTTMSWDHSGHDLQGITSASSSHDTDTLTAPTTAIDLTLGDPALLGLQLGSDPANVARGHDSFSPWLPSPSSSSYPPVIPPSSTAAAPDYAPYHVLRRACSQDAWNSIQVTGVPVNSAPFSLQFIPAELQDTYSKFQHSTSSDSGSLCKSFQPSDSGYGTQSCTTRSITTSAYAVDSSCSPQLASHHELEWAESGQESIKCDAPNCNWIGKCPSDKKKHDARHRKSFRCDEPNCNRKEGFGTINDLARHNKCVHKKEPVRGPKVVHMCFGRNCPRRNKQWPRLDNFKQHLARIHSSEDATELLKRSDAWYQEFIRGQGETAVDRLLRDEPEVFEIQQGSEDATRDFFPDHHPTVIPSQTVASSDVLRSPEDLNLDHGDCKDQSPSYQGSSPPRPAFESLNLPPSLDQTTGPSQSNTTENKETKDTVFKAATSLISAMMKIMDGNQRRQSQQTDEGVDMVDLNPNMCGRKREMVQRILSAALDQLSSHPSPKPEYDTSPIPDVIPDAVLRTDKDDWFKCKNCPRRTRLRCEMKKHQKRHERPYGCTFDKCNKTFGSKADWKRHENSQHFHLQSWRCALQDPDREDLPCALLFHHQEMYVGHLRKQHDYVDEDAVQTSLTKNRLGRNGQPQFWCGFCRTILPVRGRGLAACNERFDHIDSQHFKNGERIDDWFPPSGKLTKKRDHDEIETGAGGTSDEDGDEDDDDNSSDLSDEDMSYDPSARKRKSSAVESRRHSVDETGPVVKEDPGSRKSRKTAGDAEDPEWKLSCGPVPDFVYCCQCRNILGDMAECLWCPHTLCDGCHGRDFSGGYIPRNTS